MRNQVLSWVMAASVSACTLDGPKDQEAGDAAAPDAEAADSEADTDTDTDTDADADTDTGAEPADLDGDGFADDEDCDDGDALVHPGAAEIQDGRDNDCDGDIDCDDSDLYDIDIWRGDVSEADLPAFCDGVCARYVTGTLDLYYTTRTDLSELSCLVGVGGDVFISSSYTLTSLAGLDSLTAIGGLLRLQANPSLTSYAGLEALASVGGS